MYDEDNILDWEVDNLRWIIQNQSAAWGVAATGVLSKLDIGTDVTWARLTDDTGTLDVLFPGHVFDDYSHALVDGAQVRLVGDGEPAGLIGPERLVVKRVEAA